MAKEKKRKQPPADAAPPPGDGREGRSERKGKKARKEKAEAILPSQIKNKDKRREVHAKLKKEKKAQKRALARERGQAVRRAEELGEQPPERQVPRTIENTREPDETVCRPDDQETKCVCVQRRSLSFSGSCSVLPSELYEKVETPTSQLRMPKYTSGGKLITGHDKTFSELFSDPGITISGASSGSRSGLRSGSRKRKTAEGCQQLTQFEALQYLTEFEDNAPAILIFAAALRSQNILDGFNAKPDYASKRAYLISLWKWGIVRVDEVEGIDPRLLPRDFQ